MTVSILYLASFGYFRLDKGTLYQDDMVLLWVEGVRLVFLSGFVSIMSLSLSLLYASLFPAFLLKTICCCLLDKVTRFILFKNIMGCRGILLKMLMLIIQTLTGKILPTRTLQRIQKESIHIGGMFS